MTTSKGSMPALRTIAAATALVLVAGCTTTSGRGPRKNTEYFRQSSLEDRPVVHSVRSVSGFDDGLACMDEMLRDNGVNGVLVTSKIIPDASGKVFVSAKDMIYTSLSAMSRRSQAFRVVDYEVDPLKQDTVQTLTGLLLGANMMQIQKPQLYVSGAISFFDQNVLIGRRALGIANPDWELGASRDLISSTFGLEMHLGDFNTRTLIPGLDSANEITLASKGIGADVGGRIRKTGVQFEIGSDYSQGVGPAVRQLVDLSMIELVGKWAHVPYWQCLSLDQAHPEFQRQLYEWFRQSNPSERIAFFQNGLRTLGYYQGAADGVINAPLREALIRFQTDRHLTPSADFTFESYERLARSYVQTDGTNRFARIGWGGNQGFKGAPRTQLAAEPRQGAPALGSAPGAAKVSIALGRRDPEFFVGESMQFNISVDRTSYLNCYYQDARGSILQVYPNPLQPAQSVPGNQALLVPDLTNPMSFTIELSRPGNEQMACMATDRDIGEALPAQFKVPALSPLGVSSLAEIEAAYKAAAGQQPLGVGVKQWSVGQ